MTAIPLTQGGPADHDRFETHWRGLSIEAHLLSEVGKKRPHNEDACVICTPQNAVVFEARGILFGVADGMGGAQAGELASHLALQALVDDYYMSPKLPIPELLRDAVYAANTRVFEESVRRFDRQGMGTTVSAVVVDGDNAYIAQVGDSRVYIKRSNDHLVQVTDDHSFVAERVRSGTLSAKDARNHAMKNLLTRAIGIRGTVKVDLYATKIQEADVILICSDGLSNLVEDGAINDAISVEDTGAAAHELVDEALNNGGSDNITVIVIRVCDVPPEKEIQTGALKVALDNSLMHRLRHFLPGTSR